MLSGFELYPRWVPLKYEKTTAEFAEFKENFQHCKVPKGLNI